MPQFMKYFDVKYFSNSDKYFAVFGRTSFGTLLLFDIVNDYYKKTGKPMSADRQNAQSFFRQNPHLKDVAEKCYLITSREDELRTARMLHVPFDPDSFSFQNLIWAALNGPGTEWLDWLYTDFNNSFYPQLIVKDGHLQINKVC